MSEYHIYIHLDGEAKSKSKAMADTSTSGASTGSETSSMETSGKDAQKLMGAVRNMVSFAAIKSTADTIINNNISRITLQTGAAEYEQRMSLVYNTASSVVGAGAALGIGAAAGGPVGFAIAAMGIAVSGIQKAMAINEKQKQIDMSASLENISIDIQNVRAGANSRRRDM